MQEQIPFSFSVFLLIFREKFSRVWVFPRGLNLHSKLATFMKAAMLAPRVHMKNLLSQTVPCSEFYFPFMSLAEPHAFLEAFRLPKVLWGYL